MATIRVKHLCGHVRTHKVRHADAESARLRLRVMDCPECWSSDDPTAYYDFLLGRETPPSEDGKGGGE
jgi:hypothetical protein